MQVNPTVLLHDGLTERQCRALQWLGLAAALAGVALLAAGGAHSGWRASWQPKVLYAGGALCTALGLRAIYRWDPMRALIRGDDQLWKHKPGREPPIQSQPNWHTTQRLDQELAQAEAAVQRWPNRPRVHASKARLLAIGLSPQREHHTDPVRWGRLMTFVGRCPDGGVGSRCYAQLAENRGATLRNMRPAMPEAAEQARLDRCRDEAILAQQIAQLPTTPISWVDAQVNRIGDLYKQQARRRSRTEVLQPLEQYAASQSHDQIAVQDPLRQVILRIMHHPLTTD
jgi:hypothetical protein